MAQIATREQNEAMIKVSQLLEIARDIAAAEKLDWLAQDLDHLNEDLRFFHHEANKQPIA